VSLVSQLGISEEKRRSLIVEIQQSDFSQSSVVDYYVGVVGISQYESAITEVTRTSLAAAVTAANDDSQQVSAGDKGKLLAKIYCHGGDVAFFGDIDLEFETMINHSLLGYSASQKRRRISMESIGIKIPNVVATADIEAAISKRMGNKYSINPKYVLAVQKSLVLTMTTILQNAACTAAVRSGPPDSGVTSVSSFLFPKQGKINLSHLLLTIQSMMDKLPPNLTRDWEKIIIDKIVKIGREKINI